MSEAIKEDQRPPRGGWAPGRYFCVCATCDCYFAGDKRAVSCADCAYGEVSAGSSDSNKTECREPVGASEIVRGPSKREIKWLVKMLKTRNRHFFTGILPAEDVAMTCVLVWLGSRGMRLQARPSNDKVSEPPHP